MVSYIQNTYMMFELISAPFANSTVKGFVISFKSVSVHPVIVTGVDVYMYIYETCKII